MTNATDNVMKGIEMAGSQFAGREKEARKAVLADLIATAKKEIKTREDRDAFLKGYGEAFEGTDKSKRASKSRIKRILSVMTATDDKLNDAHGLAKPEDGVKLVTKLAKQHHGLAAMYDALKVPSAGEAEGEGEGEGEPSADDAKSLADLWSTFMGEAMNHGHTKDEIASFLATLDLTA